MARITVGLEFGRLPGVYLRGTGIYFPERDVENDQVIDLLIEHYWVSENERGLRRVSNAVAKFAGHCARHYLRRRHPETSSLIKAFGYTPAALERLGVQKRQWAHMVGDRRDDRGEHSGDMALAAARAALEHAGVTAAEIDALIVTTTTPHRLNSSTSLWVGEKLGIQGAALDLRAGCSGSLYALHQAALYLQHGCENVLVVGAEAYSRFVSPASRDAIFVAGDGAGAVVLSRSGDERGVLAGLLGAAPQHDAQFHTAGAMPPTAHSVKAGDYYVQGDPRQLVAANLKTYLTILPRVLELAGLTIGDINYHVPHQTSLSTIEAVARHLGHPMERTFVNIHEHGNIGAACLLAGLHEAREAGHLKSGEKLLLGVVGGTMTWGAMVLQQ